MAQIWYAYGMTRVKIVKITLNITEEQYKKLQKISDFSLKSQSALIREALELLFKTPGGEYKV